MSADWVHIYVRYRHNGPDEDWMWKKLKVADYLGQCCCHPRLEQEQVFSGLKPDEIYQQYKEKAVDSIECLNRYNQSSQFEEFEDCDVGGNFERIRENIVNGLRAYFPKVLFEAHCIVQWGDTIDNFWIFDGEKLYRKSYNIESVESEVSTFEDQFSEETLDRISRFLLDWEYPDDMDEEVEEEWNNWWPEKYLPPDPTEEDPYPVPETYVIDDFYDGSDSEVCYWYLTD